MGTFNRMACATVAWAFLLIAGLSVTSEAQYANIVFNRLGQPMAGAKVAICTSDPGSTTPPCSSLATTYTTISYGTACVAAAETGPMSGTGCGNPGLTDAYGNYILYANSAILYAQVYGTGITTQVFPFVIGTTATNFVDLISNQSIGGIKTFSSAPVFSAYFSVPGTTKVTNLNADLLDGTDWTAPGTIGGTTPGAATFTSATANTSFISDTFTGRTTGPTFGGITSSTTAGATVNITARQPSSAGVGGAVNITAGKGTTVNIGGDVVITAGAGANAGNAGGAVRITAGSPTNNASGSDIVLNPTGRAGAGSDGQLQIVGHANAPSASTAGNLGLIFDTSVNKAKVSENAGTFGNLVAPAIITGACTGTATSSVTRGLYLLGQTTSITCANAYTNVATPVSTRSGNVQNLRVKCGTGGFNASSGAFTVMIDGSASSVSATTGTGTTASDTIHQAAITAGQTYSVQFTTQATETLANCSASFEIQ